MKTLNPWAGLSSYQDPKYADIPLKFCGREDDTYDLSQMVMRNIFVTLYGKSGIGKTSLLNAGVFPMLRDAGFVPVSVRLNVDAADCTFQQSIISALNGLVREGIVVKTMNVIDMPSDESSQDYLWAYFARTKFIAEEGRTVFPVLVFDQFEEVFSKRRKETETLLCQLAFMVDESHCLASRIVEGESYEYDYNFRFVASIREDDLYKLEDSIDNCYLGDLKKNRYRLRNLTEKGAREVVLKPGEGIFEESEKDVIVDAILKKSADSSDSGISTNVLSLICSRLYDEASKAGSSTITLSATQSFLKGNPFEKYFKDATSWLSDSEMAYIEDNLIDESGRRNTIAYSLLLSHISKGNDLISGRYKILQVLSPSAGSGEERVELIHDSFCNPLFKQKEKRVKKRKNRRMVGEAGISIVIFATMVLLYNMKRLENEMLAIQSRFVVEKALTVLEEDSYLARKLAVEVLPKDLKHPDRPYTPEAERVLREASNYESAVLLGHQGFVNSVTYSPDGCYIVSASSDGTARIWDSRTGAFERVLPSHTKEVMSANYSPDGSEIVTSSRDRTIRIWDSCTGECKRVLSGHTKDVMSASYSPDGREIVSASYDKTVRIWDSRTGECKQVLPGHTEEVMSANYSPDGRDIVSASYDKTVRIWDSRTGICKMVMYGHSGYVNSAYYSPDGANVVSASWDNTVRIWNSLTGKCEFVLHAHMSGVTSACYSPDGADIISSSSDNTVKIWNSHTGECKRVLHGHTSMANSVNYSPDGRKIVTASYDLVCISELPVNHYDCFLLGPVCEVNIPTFSRPEKRGSKDSKPDGSFSNFSRFFKYYENYSPDANYTVIVSGEEPLTVFTKTKDHKEYYKVYSWNYPSSCTSVAFTLDGRGILVSCSDGNAYLLDFPPLQELIDETRERFKNNPLTPEERRQYYLE